MGDSLVPGLLREDAVVAPVRFEPVTDTLILLHILLVDLAD